MTKWSTSSPWLVARDGGQRRFDIFKEMYPNAIFTKDGNEIRISEAQSFDELKAKTGATKGNNPYTAGIGIIIDRKLYTLDQLERPGVRNAGTNAAKMEAFVAVATLANFNTVDDFLALVADESERKALIGRLGGVTEGELSSIVELVEFNKQYGDAFIQVAKNIVQSTPISGNTDNYEVYPRKQWEAMKGACAKLAGKQMQTSIKGDKWNPADILFIKRGFNPQSIMSDDITLINEQFRELVMNGTMIPISVKQSQEAIRGARGITGELPSDNIKSLGRLIAGGRIVDVPVSVNYEMGAKGVVGDTTLQRRILTWIIEKGKEHVERTCEIALGMIPLSSIWYEVDDVKVIQKFDDKSKRLNLDEIVVSLLSDAVWLKLSGKFLIVRSKSGSIQVTADAPRSGKYVKDFASFKIDEQHQYLLEAILLDQYSYVEPL